MRLGCIADDLTGASDLALMLSREGLKTVQTIGVPGAALDSRSRCRCGGAQNADSSGSRGCDTNDCGGGRTATSRCDAFFFKYCSTFDSTDEGNIGNVVEALPELYRQPVHVGLPGISREW